MTALNITALSASYGAGVVLRDVDLVVGQGEVVALLGSNGAGKTTTLRAISRLPGLTTTGTVELFGESLDGNRAWNLAGKGLAHVPHGRGTFPELTVEDNLMLGAHARRLRRQALHDEVERRFDLFPILAERRHQLAGSLSGGEQQMLAVSRALMSAPRLLLLDEPSLGLAPLVVEQLFDAFKRLLGESGLAILVVEQNANLALEFANRAYVLEHGAIVLDGSAVELSTDDRIRQAYLGV